MPQNEKLSPEWRQMLGEHWQEVQREWLHRLGNLTLTGYNSTYSDRPFEVKQMIPGGFSESSVRLNKLIREQLAWTPLEMDQRSEELARRALLIWPSLVVEQALIHKPQEAEIRERAQRRDVSKVPMSPAARHLFEILREKIKTLDTDIIELAEQRSVSYHERAFFLEVIPRKNQIGLLLPLEFNEIQDPSGVVEDASLWKFIVNAAHEGRAGIIGFRQTKQSSTGRRVRLRKTTISASSTTSSTVETRCFGPLRASDVVRRPFHLATVFSLSPSREARALLDSALCWISRRSLGLVRALGRDGTTRPEAAKAHSIGPLSPRAELRARRLVSRQRRSRRARPSTACACQLTGGRPEDGRHRAECELRRLASG
jgi:predicted transport protein